MPVSRQTLENMGPSELRAIGKKKCCGCKEIKDLIQFGTARKRPDGVKSDCMICASKRAKKWRGENIAKTLEKNKNNARQKRAEGNRRFLIVNKLSSSRRNARIRNHKPCTATPEELEPLFTTMCQICGVDCGNAICLDHCHVTGVFRGFICNGCNAIIGYARENVDRLGKIIDYLRKQ